LKLLTISGFECARALPPGQTGIKDPGSLDLYERSSESIYLEALAPSPS
jgi:hypothetical protein